MAMTVLGQLGVGQVVEARERRRADTSLPCASVSASSNAAAVAPGESLALIDDLPEERVAIALEHERHPDPAQLAKLELATREPASDAHTGVPRARQHARGVEHAISRDVVVHSGDRDRHARFRARPALRRRRRRARRAEAAGAGALAVRAWTHRRRARLARRGLLFANSSSAGRHRAGSDAPGSGARTVVDDAVAWRAHDGIESTERAETKVQRATP